MPYIVIHNEREFKELFAAWPNVGATIRWAPRASELYRTRFHAVGPNRKTACGLTVPPVGGLAMETGGDTTCQNCRSTWTVH